MVQLRLDRFGQFIELGHVLVDRGVVILNLLHSRLQLSQERMMGGDVGSAGKVSGEESESCCRLTFTWVNSGAQLHTSSR